jgi:hypothetical protein
MHPIASFFGTCCIEKGCQGKGKTLHDYFEKVIICNFWSLLNKLNFGNFQLSNISSFFIATPP